MFALVLFFPLCSLAQAFRVIIPTDEPSIVQTTAVNHDLFSFSIEQDRWPDWVGHTARNEFFYNTLDNLKQLAGAPPRIRVGGKSQDVTYFDLSMQGHEVVFENSTPATPYPEALSMKVGPNFYSSARFLPEGTRVVHGLNFASTDDLRGLLHLTGIISAYRSSPIQNAGVKLDAIEIGNEPNLYDTTSRASGYSASHYVKEWQAWAGNVLDVETWYPDFRMQYWAASVSHSAQNSPEWSPGALLEAGLLVSDAGRRVSTVSQHHYSGDSCETSHDDVEAFTSKANIRASLDGLRSDIQASLENEVEYVLGEAGSYTCHGAVGASNTAAAALWALDYALHAATIGVSRIFFHQGIGYRSNFMQPIPLNESTTDGAELPHPHGPYVTPQYYAALVAAEAFGAQGHARILELPVKDKRVAAYAIYKQGIPTRVLFINTQPYYPSATGIFQTRPSIRVSLELEGFPEDASHLIKRLSIPYSDSTSGVTWGGVTYETEDGRPQGEEDIECIDAGEEFDLYATEVVLVMLQEVEDSD